MANFFDKFIKGGKRTRVYQVFGFIMVLFVGALLIDGGNYYNQAAGYLKDKTGYVIKLPEVKELPFRLGLDLQGGTQLIYQADMSATPEADRSIALKGARDVIERRVNSFGTSEPRVETTQTAMGDYQLIIELAGEKDIDKAIKMIGETPLLEFKEPSEEAPKLTPEQQKELDDYNKAAEKKAEEVLGKLISGGDFNELAKAYSEDQATADSGGELAGISEKDNPELYALVAKLKPGEYTQELQRTAEGYEIIKLEGKKEKTDPFNDNEVLKEIQAAHILICHAESEGCESDLSKADALNKIKEIEKEATPQNFKELAKRYSNEPGADQSGGELGWFFEGQMVKPFEDAVYAQKTGTISFVVETKFGFHLIYKEGERPITEYSARRILIRAKTAQDIIGQQETEWKNTELTGKYLERSSVQFNPNDGTPQVSLDFDDEGSELFAAITKRNIGKPVAIFLDGYVISQPTVQEEITGGKAVISGSFNVKEANLLAQRLNAGALPVPISIVSQQTVGASLGQDAVDASIKAGLIGLSLIALFMIIAYRLPGLLSVFSLLIYGALVMAVFKLWPVTLTLPGLAGFIMSIGVAVDANVLIFARLQEELKAGKPLNIAIDEAFRRAWPSIRDGNFSTLITCVILYYFSTSFIKGFAITLALGVVTSLFTGIIVTRNFLNLIYGGWLAKFPWLMGMGKGRKETATE